MELHGKNAVVTGAGGGIGRAIATALAQAGAHVLAFDRDFAAVEKLAGVIGAGCEPVGVDLADAEALRIAIDATLDRRARIDVLVNNAGILSPHKLAATTLDEWHRLMAINLDAAMLLTQAVVPGMRQARW